jgi:WD40 repeat protein/tetratricopeptide (TPR) repeat protein
MKYELKDAFISYGRRESLNFVARLHQQLKLAGYEVWFDKVNIPDSDDYAQRINHGIESAHNFVYVMAPRCLTSPYCLIELEYARLLGKRVIPINQMSISKTDLRPLSDKDQQTLVRFYQFYDLPAQNIRTTQDVLDRSRELIGKTDWLDAKEKVSDEDCQRIANWAQPYENNWAKHEQIDYLNNLKLPVFGKTIDALPGVVERVTAVLERQKAYIHQHTQILAEALHWQTHQKATQHLLVGPERTAAEKWLLTEFTPPAQPPCQPSALVCEFICEARKNAENLMTDLFICASTADIAVRNALRGALSRYAKTVWTHDRDIQTGIDYQQAINIGIENADNLIFLISPDSIASEHCQRELTYALQYNKRVIPLLITSLPASEIPEKLRGLQYIDFTETYREAGLDEILVILQLDHEYYELHKVLLARALKWTAEEHKSAFLLRGHNLEKAKTWLRANEKREQHSPLPLHKALITASDTAGQLSTEVFVSYSRKDSDFARQLNAQLLKAGKTTWFDQENIDPGADFEMEIFKGIDSADNFLFVLSPLSVASPYCESEVNHAVSRGKRLITVLHRETDPNTMPTALRAIQWLDFRNSAEFETALLALRRVLEQQQAYIHQHTEILARALYWEQHQKASQYLFVGEERLAAEQWLLTEFRPPNKVTESATLNQALCRPTLLMCELICEARKNADDRQTALFICYDVQDKAIRDAVVQSLSRHLKTCWQHDRDIPKGEQYEYAIEQGIEGADNVLFFISPSSVKSEYCQRELAHAVKYHKRIIPFKIAPTPTSDIPEALRGLQYIDLTEKTAPATHESKIDEILKILADDQEYYKQHKQLLVRSRKWAAENRNSIFLLQGHKLETAKAWLRLSSKRQQQLPLPLHHELITASDNATRQVGTALFISYARKDNDFVRQLNTKLQEAGKTVWFDEETQASSLNASGVDFETESFKGIDHADNFVFVVSPPSVASRYCRAELNHAVSRGKRIIAVKYREIDPNTMPAALQAVQLDFSDPAEFDANFLALARTLEREKAYLHQHTEILAQALDWQQHQKATQYLFVGKERTAAQAWLLTEFLPPNQPPCQPTPLMCEFICEARKNAENLMTDIFICYDAHDKDIRQSVVQSLSRYAKTCWVPLREIQQGEQYERAISHGIEGADNFFFFISPASVASEACRRELAQALKYHKRIVPLLIAPTPLSAMPDALRSLQFVDLTDKTSQADYDSDINDILNFLKQEQDYYKQHKVLLVRALKWEVENHNPAFLLRGHNLENAKTWLRLNDKREQHLPLALHRQLIAESEAAKGQLSTEVFLSYSRKDSDFARHLNTQLQEAGKTTWFDQESISTGVDFEKEIFKGIDSADNFVFVLSPDAVQSEYCEREVSYAADNRKRFISVLHRDTEPATMPTALQKINWIDFQTTPFENSFPELIQAIELDREHAHQHTVLQQRASDWAENNRSPDFLLNLTACTNAENWQETALTENKQPAPTELQRNFIVDSRKAIKKANRRRNILLSSAIVGMMMALILAFFAVVQMKDAKQARTKAEKSEQKAKEAEADAIVQKNEALKTQSLFLTDLSRQQTEKGHTVEGMLLALEALPKTFPVHDRPYVAEAEDQLHKAVVAHTTTTSYAEHLVLEGDDSVSQVAFSPDGKTLVAATTGTHVQLFNATSGQRLQTLIGHTSDVNHVAFSPDGSLLVTASSDNTARLWQVPSGKLVQTLAEHQGYVTHAAFSPDGSLLVTASYDNTARLWQVPSGKPVKTLAGHYGNVNHAAFSPDGSLLVTASNDGTARLWQVPSGKPVKALAGHQGYVRHAAFSPDGSLLVTASSDNTARLWQVPSSKPVKTLAGHYGDVNHAAFSLDGSKLVTASSDNTARLWQVPSGKPVKTLAGHYGDVNHAAFSPDGSLLVTASRDRTARLWQIPSGKPVQKLVGHAGTIFHAALSPDGSLLVTASWDNTARLWQVPSGKPVKTLAGHQDEVNHAALSPDGFRLVTASSDKTARLWQVPSGKPVKTLAGHQDEVNHAAFSPDGSLLVTASSDKTARLWQVPSGKPVKTLAGHFKRVTHAAFSPDGSLLVTASLDKTARLWLASTQALIDYANERVPRCLTSTQRQDFFLSELPAAWGLMESGEQLAKTGQIPEAVAQFQRAGQQMPCLKFDPTEKAQKLAAQAQIALGKTLLKDGNRNEAIAAFKSAIQIDSRLNGLPLVANHSIKEGNKLAKQGKITAAIAEFSQAKKLVPSFLFEPETKAKQLYAPVLVREGEALAKKGELEAAVAKFFKAQALDSSLTFEPETKAKQLYAPVLFEQGEALAKKGELDAAVAKFFKAQALDSSLTFEPETKAKLLYALVLVEQGQELADIGELDAAVAKFFKALALDSTLTKAKQFHAQVLVRQGEALARKGELDAAVAKFKEALALDSSLTFEPETKAKQLYAPVLVRQGQYLADIGELDAAVAKFKDALALDSTLTKAKQFHAQVLVRQGEALAEKGELEAAVAKFFKAQTLDSSLTFEPETKAKQLYAPVLVEQGEELAKQRKFDAAIAKSQEAQQMDASVEIEAWQWNNLCWCGSLYGQATKVIKYCEKAVALVPSSWLYRDSRGLARALAGNFQGAIEDFQFVINKNKQFPEDFKPQMQGWINTLKKGKNPFTEEVLKELRQDSY